MRRVIVLLGAVGLGLLSVGCHAQVVNWDAVTPRDPSADAVTPIPEPDPAHEPATAPTPAPIRQPKVPPAPVPTSPADIGSMAGYRQEAGAPPTRQLDRRVSGELMKRYAQQPGESESHYIDRMAKLYRDTQARMEADQAKNAAYIRSLAPQEMPTTAPPAKGH